MHACMHAQPIHVIIWHEVCTCIYAIIMQSTTIRIIVRERNIHRKNLGSSWDSNPDCYYITGPGPALILAEGKITARI